MLSEYQQRLLRIKNGQEPKTTGPKPKKPLKKIGDKKKQADKESKEARQGEDTMLEKWFKNRRKDTLVGTCQCGCGRKSSKFDDLNFRSSCCHIFPKAKFESVALHRLNCVERNFWDGCHTNMDQRGLDRWPMFADWDDIRAKFHELAPLLTDEERATKFYSKLETLVYSK